MAATDVPSVPSRGSSNEYIKDAFQSYYEALVKAINNPDEIALKLYSAKAISKQTLSVSVDESKTKYRKSVELVQAVETFLETHDSSVKSVYILSLLNKFPPLDSVVTKILRDSRRSATARFGEESNARSAPAERQRMMILGVPERYSYEFSMLKGGFASLLRSVKQLVQKESNLDDLKDFLHYFYRKEMSTCDNIQAAQNIEDLFDNVIVPKCTLTNCSLLRSIAVELCIPEISAKMDKFNAEYVKPSKDSLRKEEFGGVINQEILQHRSSNDDLPRTRIKLKVEWADSEATLDEFHALVREVFPGLSRWIDLDVVECGCVSFLCSAPDHMEEALLQMAEEQVQVAIQKKVTILEVGTKIILDTTTSKQELIESKESVFGVGTAQDSRSLLSPLHSREEAVTTQPEKPVAKESSVSSLAVNTHVCEAAPPELEKYECLICLEVVPQAYQAICCHKFFCFDCIQRSVNESKCPHCRREPWLYENCTQADTATREMKISCNDEEDELFSYESHMSKTGPVVRIECFDCKQLVPRSSHMTHLMNECPLRITSCPHCEKVDEHQKIVEHMVKECLEALIKCKNDGCLETMKRKDMDTHQKHCPHQSVPCKYSKQIGCKEVVVCKHMDDHENHSLQSHFQLALQRIHELENTMTPQDYMKESLISRVPVTFKIDQFSIRKKGNKMWQSDPFYTHPQGYKLCLRVYPNGVEVGKGCAVSIYLHLMKGPFDKRLRWPFLCVFQVAVLNQHENTNHKIEEIKFINNREEIYNQRVLSDDKPVSDIGLGNPMFLRHTELEKKKRYDATQCLKNDCILVSVQSANVLSASNA